MKKIQIALAVIILCGATSTFGQKSGQSTQISIGIVESAGQVELKQSNTGKGLAAGTAVGALRSSNNRTRSVVTGAVIGGAVGKVASKSEQGREYSVRTGPNSVIAVVSNQTEIHVGDCVTVQQSGGMANVTRIDQSKCSQVASLDPQDQASAPSGNTPCETAKTDFANASTQEALDMAKQKMDVLCQ
ncbi:hypothetical protein [Desulfosediminicola flagellatus]|uniref:hypothetical protein n=1 Tax=Desulfosediminicola flagellatus TaxID=2569541 RepID=UPI0010AC1079|nr:hypothetical protein [Desulfosediminicola flagellatus]